MCFFITAVLCGTVLPPLLLIGLRSLLQKFVISIGPNPYHCPLWEGLTFLFAGKYKRSCFAEGTNPFISLDFFSLFLQRATLVLHHSNMPAISIPFARIKSFQSSFCLSFVGQLTRFCYSFLLFLFKSSMLCLFQKCCLCFSTYFTIVRLTITCQHLVATLIVILPYDKFHKEINQDFTRPSPLACSG